MEINPIIREKLREFNIPESAGILVLLALYHDLEQSYDLHSIKPPSEVGAVGSMFNPTVFKQIQLTKIVERDYTSQWGLKWNIPLYVTQEADVEGAWLWVVRDYRPIFEEIRNDARGDKQGCIKKMKKFFADNPAVRIQDVLQAARLYRSTFMNQKQNPKYFKRADYFISKIEDGSKISMLSTYLEMLGDSSKTEDKLTHRGLNQVVR